MECYLFTSHYWLEKFHVDKFIANVFSIYGNQKSFNIYERRVGQELLIYLETGDFKISRIFIDHFINYGHGYISTDDLCLLKLSQSK